MKKICEELYCYLGNWMAMVVKEKLKGDDMYKPEVSI